MRSFALSYAHCFKATCALMAAILVSTGARSQHIQNSATRAPNPNIRLGIDVLEQRGFDILRGKRVGLLTHSPGVNRYGISTITVMNQSREVNLVALYSPEHGLDGQTAAGASIDDSRHVRTGLPVYSLHGKTRKPTPKMLSAIDTLVVDLQDIGVRSYTFVSCMKLALEACFENGIAVVILDRPNPLGGLKVDGPIIEKQWRSYVGSFPVPYVHGMTIGELARMATTSPGILDITDQQRRNGSLTVITMEGWRRYMSWPMTALRWEPTSPNIPTFESVVGYAMTGLGAQLGGFYHGIGSEYPFRILQFKDVNTENLSKEFARIDIPGITLEQRKFKNGQAIGLYVKISNWRAWRPTEISFHMMQIAAKLEGSNPFAQADEKQATLFNKHVGSTSLWNELQSRGANANIAGFILSWERDAREFQIRSRQYWLYN